MRLATIALSTAVLGVLAAPLASPASAQGVVNVYCSVQVEWCTLAANEFQKATGIKVSMSQKGSGETIAQLKAEAQNPKGDVWFGGTGDPHLQAAEEGLTDVYKSPKLGELHPWAVKQNTDSGGKTVGIYAGALGFGFNTELLAKKNVKAPACWADLLKPEFKGEIQMANPNSSGTAYVAIATLVQLMGEEEAFKYLKKMHANINAYTRSGTAPMKAVARGETMVSISFVHDGVSDRIIVMNAGRIEQQGSPRDLYERPATPFLARFMGESNPARGLLRRLDPTTVRVRLGTCELDVANTGAADGEATLAIRPEAIAVVRPADAGPDTLAGTIAKASYLGTHMEYSIDTAAGLLFAICPHVDRPLAAGDPVALRLAPRGVLVVES